MPNPYDQFDVKPTAAEAAQIATNRADPANATRLTVDISGTPAPAPNANPYDQFDGPKLTGTPVVQTSPKSFTTKDRSGRSVAFTVASDATDDEIRQAAADALGSKAYLKSAVQRGEITPTDQSKATGFFSGLMKPVDNLATAINKIPGVSAIDHAISSVTGLPTVDQAVATNDATRANNARTGYQTIGNIAGTAPTAMIPGGIAVQGAAAGGLLSEADHPLQLAEDMGKGALGAIVGNKVFQGLGTLAGGITNKASNLLYQAGVPQTIGQIARNTGTLTGKMVGGIEDRLSGLPIIGDVINAARDRGVNGINLAVGNRILANAGSKLPEGTMAGHDMVDTIERTLSGKYEQLIPKLTGTMDNDFASDLTAAKSITDTLPDEKQRQFANLVQSVFKNRVTTAPNGGFQIVPAGQSTANGPSILTGQALKDAESQLTKIYGKYKNAQGDEGIYGDAVDALRTSLRNMLTRSNPDDAAELQGLNKGWAQLKQLRVASKAAGNNDTGIATPATLLRVFGKDYRDPLLEAGKQTLANRVPDSGTTGRAALALAAAGSGGAEVMGHPYLAGGILAGSAPYTEIGQDALNKILMASRGKAGYRAAIPLKALAKMSPVYAPQLVGATTGGSGQK